MEEPDLGVNVTSTDSWPQTPGLKQDPGPHSCPRTRAGHIHLCVPVSAPPPDCELPEGHVCLGSQWKDPHCLLGPWHRVEIHKTDVWGFFS